MSSSYDYIDFEARRREELARQVLQQVNNLKNQLSQKGDNSVVFSNHVCNISVVIREDTFHDYDSEADDSGDRLRQRTRAAKDGERQELDFSFLLSDAGKKPTPLEMELDSWIKKIDERVIYSEKDAKDRKNLLTILESLIRNPDIDIEEKLDVVKMRVNAFLGGMIPLSEAEKKRLTDLYYEYCALCEMLDMTPIEIFPYRLEEEVERMKAVLNKRAEDEYVLTAIAEIMEEMGCAPIDEVSLDNVDGQIFSVAGQDSCNVFIGSKSGGLMFEPIIESAPTSVDKKKKTEADEAHVCALMKELEERAKERGILLTNVYRDQLPVEEMVQTAETKKRKAKKKLGVAPKTMAINSEG